MKKSIIIILVLVLCQFILVSEVTFSGLDVTIDNNLLFKASTNLPEWGNYDTLFLASLENKSIKQLTFFPEKIVFLDHNRVLQIQNRFGVFRTDKELKNITPIEIFPSFVNGNEIANGKINPIQASPDGKFLVYMKQTSTAFGELCLYDTTKSAEIVISKEFELLLNGPITRWSPDSKYLVYGTKNSIYYFSIHQYSEDRIITESLRKISDGTIASTKWDQQNYLYYIDDSLVYRIASSELFTQSLYTMVLKMGKIAGKIPFDFDSNFDSFWISPDGKKLLFNKGGGNIILYFLSNEDFLSTGSPKSLPYLYLSRNTKVKKVIWSRTDVVTLLTQGIEKGKTKYNIFRLTVPQKGDVPPFSQTQEEGIKNIVLSPDETKIALIREDAVDIYNYGSFTKNKTIEYSTPVTVLWRNDSEILIAGQYTYHYHNLSNNTSRLITLAQCGEYGFASGNMAIQTKIDNQNYMKINDENTWQETNTSNTRESQVATSDYRVYLEYATRGSYNNLVMVRDINGYITTPLFPREEFEYESFPLKEEPISFENFSHGSRIRAREVSLVFDALNSIEGLTIILNVLAEYNLRCTFFVNGEVIRRYPDAVKDIAESGHEVGSLFYIPFNMTDSKYTLDKEYIKNGLARTEDEYFNYTGKEVSLLWHAPYYFINSEMIEASQEMNYVYVGRDIDSLDWVTKDDIVLTSNIYLSSSLLVERIIKKKQPGSIIPILVGIPDEKREDYLFEKLELLINGLIKSGYSIVPVSRLIENSK